MQCLCVCPVRLFTLKALTYKLHFWYAGIFQNIYAKFVYQGNRVRVVGYGSKNACLYVLFASDLPPTERQSSFYVLLQLYVYTRHESNTPVAAKPLHNFRGKNDRMEDTFLVG